MTTNINMNQSDMRLQKAQQTKEIASVARTTDGAKEQQISSVASTRENTDTLSISAEGKAALEQMKVSEQTVQAPEGQEAQAASASSASAGMPSVSGNEDDEDTAATVTSDFAALSESSESSSDEATIESASSSSATNLTSLTETQISDMVSEGSITQAEANAELARRTTNQQAQQTGSDHSGQQVQPDKIEQEAKQAYLRAQESTNNQTASVMMNAVA